LNRGIESSSCTDEGRAGARPILRVQQNGGNEHAARRYCKGRPGLVRLSDGIAPKPARA
jgi:hypothetical protein